MLTPGAQSGPVGPADRPVPPALPPKVAQLIALGKPRGVEANRDDLGARDGQALPLDCTDPEERIEEMVEEAQTH